MLMIVYLTAENAEFAEKDLTTVAQEISNFLCALGDLGG
jgi:hypothetical protein